MHLPTVSLLLAATALAAPADSPSEAELQKRQDYSALLSLAASAGVSIPTDDPALLLSLAPVAAQLASYLPTAPVLSALQTAAPSGFLSNIIHDPSYAASFESQFAAGSSPSWFLGLPSSVRDYLHTYSDYGGVATGIGQAETIIATATEGSASGSGSATEGSSATTGAVTKTDTETQTQTDTNTAKVTLASGSEGLSTSASKTASGAGASASSAASDASSSASDASSSASDSSAAASSSTASEGNAAATLASSSSASTGGAPRETGAIAAGVAAVAGVLGLAIAL